MYQNGENQTTAGTICVMPPHRSIAPYSIRQRAKICGVEGGRPCVLCFRILAVSCFIIGFIMLNLWLNIFIISGIIIIILGLVLLIASIVIGCHTKEKLQEFQSPDEIINPNISPSNANPGQPINISTQPIGNLGQPSPYSGQPYLHFGQQPDVNPSQPTPYFEQQAHSPSQPAAYPEKPSHNQPAAQYGQTAPIVPAPGQMTESYPYFPPTQALPQPLAPTNYPMAPPTTTLPNNRTGIPSGPMQHLTYYQMKDDQPPPYTP